MQGVVWLFHDREERFLLGCNLAGIYQISEQGWGEGPRGTKPSEHEDMAIPAEVKKVRNPLLVITAFSTENVSGSVS